jgi:molybdopterin synthase catalytic subunit
MRLTIQLFAAAKQFAGKGKIELELDERATVHQLREVLVAEYPELRLLLSHARVAVNADYALEDQELRPSDEIAIIPPVSGG